MMRKCSMSAGHRVVAFWKWQVVDFIRIYDHNRFNQLNGSGFSDFVGSVPHDRSKRRKLGRWTCSPLENFRCRFFLVCRSDLCGVTRQNFARCGPETLHILQLGEGALSAE